jgi:hypothetical protein
MLSFGDYTGGNSLDSQSYATQVFGGPGQQHSVGTVDGGNENNVISTKYVSNCPMSGGRRSRKMKKSMKRNNKSKKVHRKVHGGVHRGMDKSHMKTLAKMAIKEEMNKMKKGGDLIDIAKTAVQKTVDTGSAFKNAVKDSASKVFEKGVDLTKAVKKTISGGKINKTLKKMIRKEIKKH